MGFTNEELKAMSKTVSKTRNKYQRYCIMVVGCKQKEYVSRNNYKRLREIYLLCKRYGYKCYYLGELTCSLAKLEPYEIIYKEVSLDKAVRYLRKIKAMAKKDKKNDKSRTN